MLKSLSVRNYALIDQLEVELRPGMTAITGETGSGKSILLGALGLALGDRADLKSLLRNDQKCVVEICVSLPESKRSFFDTNDLDFEPDTLIRREITPSGKSRSFINDTPVPLTLTRGLAAEVIDIHSQHESSLIASSGFQRSLLDGYAKAQIDLQAYQARFAEWEARQTAFETLKVESEQWERDRDYLEFQLRELEAINLDDLDSEALESSVKAMESAGEIQEALAQAGQLIDSDLGIEALLSQAEHAVSRISAISPAFSSMLDRLEALRIEVSDLSAEMQHQAESVDSDPRQLEQALSILNAFHNLSQKHLVSTVEDLRVRRDEIQDKLSRSEHASADLEEMEQQVADLRFQVVEAAGDLSRKRSDAIPVMLQDLRVFLDQLGLEHARFEVHMAPSSQPYRHGMDEVELRFCANPGSPFLPIAKVASGGEISRVMLALKACMARKNDLPCLIFDEIDTGISGEMARKVGQVLKGLSSHAQLITITHQPSIAGAADQHLKVFKEITGDSSQTNIQVLDNEARVQEIAEMISGQEVTDASRTSARELLAE